MKLTKVQEQIWIWCQETFEGIASWRTDKERAYRFLEESVELFQSVGMEKEDAYKVVDYVFGRPVGEPSQEIGGTMVTLLALASHLGLDVNEALIEEYERITRPEIQQKIREKQKAKNQHFL